MNSDKNAYFLSLPEITELSVPPKTILLEEGKVADRMYLIRKGCLRLFFNNEGRDITFQFFFEGDFVASFDSLYQRTPSLFSLESIEPAELSVMKREDFFRNLGQKPALRQIYEEKIIERFHVYQRLFLSRIKNTPQQRYEELLKEHPSIIQRIPQHYIASYLGDYFCFPVEDQKQAIVHFFTFVIVRFQSKMRTLPHLLKPKDR